jgi:rieske iron-sulfur protein
MLRGCARDEPLQVLESLGDGIRVMTKEKPHEPAPTRAGAHRRGVLTAAVGLALGAPLLGRAAVGASDDARKEKPQPGDVLVHIGGERKGQPVLVEDLPLGGPQELGYPMDPATKTVRDGSRLNQVAIVRLDPAELSEQTAEHAGDGVVAYSAFCTHQGCPVSMWEPKNNSLLCSCHASQFDPREAGAVVGGPASRRLATLPVKIEDSKVVVAGEFVGRVGIQKA